MPQTVLQYMSKMNFGSEKDIRKMIKTGVITVNKVQVKPIYMMKPGDLIHIKGELFDVDKHIVYLVLHQPKHIMNSDHPDDKMDIDKYVKVPLPMRNVDPLHYTSEGLVIYTNDKTFIPVWDEEYVVRLDRDYKDIFIKSIMRGVLLKNRVFKPTYIERINGEHFRIHGVNLNDQDIYTIVESMGYHVRRMMRVRIGDIVIDEIKKKKWRFLTKDEIQKLKDQAVA